jgi:hypothetical protein
MHKLALIVGACAATTLLAGQANAGTLTAKLGSVNPRTTNLSVSFNSGTNFTNNAIVGEFNWTVAASPAPTINPGDPGYGTISAGTPFQTFCIEGTQSVSVGGSYLYTLSALSGATKEALTEFWADNFSSIGTSSINAAAFQLGIWEIVYDYGNDGTKIGVGLPGAGNYSYGGVTSSVFTSGTFRVGTSFVTPTPDPAVSEAVIMLKKITGNFSTTAFVLGDLSSGTNQDQLASFSPPVGAPPVVPLPAALPVGGAMLSLMGIVAGIRKRR